MLPAQLQRQATFQDRTHTGSFGPRPEGYTTPALGNHKVTHQDGGTDEIDVGGLSGVLADSQPPAAHHLDHENGGADEISVSGLSGELADAQPPKAHGNADHTSVFATEGYAVAAAVAEVDDHEGLADPHTGYVKHSLATTVSDFLVASGVGAFVKKTLAEVKTILGLGTAAFTAATDYAVAAKGVTNGDAHDHAGGDGAQIDHGGLAGLADDDHAQYHTDARGDARYSAIGHDHDATYVNEADHTKAAHDALDIDADTLDGAHASATPAASQIPILTADKYLGIGSFRVIGRVDGSFATAVSSNASVILGANMYVAQDGSYNRVETGETAAMIIFAKDGAMTYYKASAGANPIAAWDLVNGVNIWNGANDGSGSGLDADLLDGNHAAAFALSGHDHDATYAPIAKGVTNGDSHDHSGGDGAQIDHVNLANKGTNTHAQIDTALSELTHPDNTFTPIVKGSTAAGVGTYVAQAGWYQRIGKMCFFSIDVHWTAHTGTGEMQVGGLPLAAAGGYNFAVSIMLNNITFANLPAALIISGNDFVTLYTHSTGAGVAKINMDSSGGVWISGCYRVA